MWEFNDIKTYFHNLDRPEYGLAYCGITLIPPTSLNEFRIILLKEKKSRYPKELNELIELVEKASEEDRYIIHYGI